MAGCVRVNAVTAQVAAVTNDKVLKLMSAPLVPTEPCAITVPAPDLIRQYPHVPVASIDESEVIAAAVAVPPEDAPKDVALKVVVARSVPLSASVVLVGAAPVRK